MNAPAKAKARVSTGIPGLDAVLWDGLLQGSVTIVQGSPGAGKTVLANQFAFHRAAQGGRVLYLTLLSESHGRLLSHISQMSFFDPAAVATQVRYMSGFDTLEREGIKGVLRLLATEARSLGAVAIVLDGLFVLEESADSSREFRKFVNALSLQAEAMDCTVLLLTNSSRDTSSPEYTMVDGWIELSRSLHGSRSERSLQVHKQRGSGFHAGLHSVVISHEGIAVLPRMEVLPEALQPDSGGSQDRVTTGNPALDAMIEGGLRAGSTALVTGPAGVGKTTLGLQLLGPCSEREPGMVFTFFERPDRLCAKAESLDLPLRAAVERGHVRVAWNPPTEASMDMLGHQLLDAVRRHGVKRLLVDGVDGLRQAAVDPARISRFLSALANALRALGCTTLFTMEQPQVFGRPHDVELESLSAVAENLLFLRYVERAGRLHRLLTLIKVRDRGFDHTTREFHIGQGGLQIGDPLPPHPEGQA